MIIIIIIIQLIVQIIFGYFCYKFGYDTRESEFQKGDISFTSHGYPIMNIRKLELGYKIKIYDEKFITIEK